MRQLFVPILLITAVLLILIVPFVFFGEPLESRMRQWVAGDLSAATMAGLVVTLLAVDIFLPVPSSVVSTVAGRVLGVVGGTLASWLGLTLGALIAFALARTLGRRVALRFCKEEDFARTDQLSRRYGPAILVLARPVPVLAEATVLFFGTTTLPWQRFLVPVALSNLGIAAVYAELGSAVDLPVALVASVVLPMLAAVIARRLWPDENGSSGDEFREVAQGDEPRSDGGQ